MAFEDSQFMKKSKLFLQLLKQDGIDVSEAYVFGSAITGLADNDSDIDIAVVSNNFVGLPYYDIKKISKYRRKVDLHLEIHPFSLSEVTTDPSHFFMYIKKNGIKIQ